MSILLLHSNGKLQNQEYMYCKFIENYTQNSKLNKDYKIIQSFLVTQLFDSDLEDTQILNKYLTAFLLFWLKSYLPKHTLDINRLTNQHIFHSFNDISYKKFFHFQKIHNYIGSHSLQNVH